MNTPDPFTDAARAEADRQYWANPNAATSLPGHRGPFTAGAEWARAHLAAQEPSDAEVEAAAIALGEIDISMRGLDGTTYRELARAALSAARAARRDEEKR